MKPGYSKLLLNELVVPDTGAGIVLTELDLTMMCAHGAEERSEGQWRDMLDQAGLKVVKIWTSAQETESIIEAELR